MRYVLLLVAFLVTLLAGADPAGALCRCQHPKRPRCADKTAKHTITVNINFDVVDDSVEVLTQSGPYRLPVAELTGKSVLFVFTPRGQVFQGIQDIIPGSLGIGAMAGATASITTGAVFAPGEYELALFVDVVQGGTAIGPQRGDLAAFDNTICDPTGVSVRVLVGCEDATVQLENRHFIIF